MRKIIAFMMIALIAAGFAFAGAAKESATVSTDGSTSMEKVILSLAEQYMADNQDVNVTYNPTGSGTGITAALEGRCDIGLSSRALKAEEVASGLKETIVALDGIAIIVNADNPVSDLTIDQIAGLYNGTYTNWSEVGGADQNIVVIGRESGSGTRDAFEEILDIADQCQLAQTLNETGAVAAAVQSTPGAIGYISLDALNDKVKALQLDGVAPSEETVKDGSYTLQRPFVMATKGEISEQSAQVQAVFEFINSDAGQEVISSVGLVSAK